MWAGWLKTMAGSNAGGGSCAGRFPAAGRGVALAPATATLGYAGSYTVTGRGGGTLTWLRSAGQVCGVGLPETSAQQGDLHR